MLVTALIGLAAGCATQPAAWQVPELPQQARNDPARFLVITIRNDAEPAVVSPGSTPRGYGADGTYSVNERTRATTRSVEREYHLREVSAWPIASLRVHCVVVRLPPLARRSAVIARLTRDSRVDSVQPLNQFTTEESPTSEADGSDGTPPRGRSYRSLQVNLQQLGVLEAHQLSRGEAIRIAIIDTGVDYRHPDLHGRIFDQRDLVGNGSHEFTSDRHGTEVAGVIAAVSEGGDGVLGVAPASRLLVLKACWPVRSDASQADCNSFTLAQALEAAIAAHVDLVNLSLAGPPDPLLERLVRYGMAQGIIYVGAVPPEHAGPADTFPTDVQGVLAVQSAEDAHGDTRQLLAPGHNILTLVPDGHYDFASGSSLATAEVTGIVALLLADDRKLPGPEVDRILARSSRPVQTAAGSIVSVDACAAIAEALSRASCGAPAEAFQRMRRVSPRRRESDNFMKLNEVSIGTRGSDAAGTVVVTHSRS
jgi:subtilisin family serine protease